MIHSISTFYRTTSNDFLWNVEIGKDLFEIVTHVREGGNVVLK